MKGPRVAQLEPISAHIQYHRTVPTRRHAGLDAIGGRRGGTLEKWAAGATHAAEISYRAHGPSSQPLRHDHFAAKATTATDEVV